MKDRGKFVCEPNDQGMHGDTFDADKLAGHALSGGSGRTIVPDQQSRDREGATKWPPYSCEPPLTAQPCSF
jgi:hypothetical protein